MIAKIMSVGLKGVEGYRVQVEVHTLDGVDTFLIVGLPDASVKESKERVTSALHSLGYPIIDRKIIVNLSPAEQKKKNEIANAMALKSPLRPKKHKKIEKVCILWYCLIAKPNNPRKDILFLMNIIPRITPKIHYYISLKFRGPP